MNEKNDLRRKAEEKLKGRETSVEALSGDDARRLIHELQVHQIELEMQNDELRCAQEELEASRARLADLYDFAPVGYVTLDSKGTVREANLTAAVQLGVERRFISGRPFSVFLKSGESEFFFSFVKAALQGGSREVCELTLRPKKGEPIHARLHGVPASDGGVDVLRVSITDITDLKRAQDELRKLSQAVEQSPTPVMVTDLDGTIEYVNPMFSAFTGYTLDEVSGRNANILKSGIHPREYFDNIWSTINSGRVWRGDICNRKKNGELYWELLSISPIRDAKGGITGYLSVKVEDTERKKAEEALRESEERYRALVEHSPDAITVNDTDGKIVFANVKGAKFFGAGSPAKLAGRNISEFLSPESLEDVKRAMARTAAERRPSGTVEARLVRLDGVSFDGEVMTVPLASKDGFDIIVIVRDITERKRMEEELLKVQKLESLGVMAGGIAHDFNNLLTAILGNISVLKLSFRDEDREKAMLNNAEKAAVRARRLTNRLLTFSTGGAPVKQSISLGELIRETAAFVMSGSKSGCEFSLPGDLWSVEADEGQLAQVFQNLVINADQAMGQGATVMVSAENTIIGRGEHPVLPEGKYVRITVGDCGPGIARGDLPRIFDPFFTTKPGGTGLGLTTCYSVVKAHDGHIAVDSRPGDGTAFHVYLPASSRAASSEHTAPKEIVRGSGRVLFMDDEELIRNSAGLALKVAGYEVSCASDGKEAIEAYTRAMESGNPFDAVILDLTVPGGMGGQEAAASIMEADPGARLLVSSGYSDDLVMGDFCEYGFKGIVKKPYTPYELTKALRDVMDKNGT